jgi:DNA-directed RNA polymerase subunit A'
MAARAAVPTAPPHTLRAVDFKLLTDEDIRDMAVVEVTSSKLHNHGTPVPGGLIDSRFGVCSRFYTCGTCKNTVDKCLGHYGFIDLAYPLPLVATVPFLERLLRVFCWNCSALLIKVRSGVIGTAAALAWVTHEIEKMHRRKTIPFCCPNCEFLQPMMSLDGPFVRLVWNEDAVHRWPGRAALLENDEDETAAVAVPPPAKRKRCVEGDATESNSSGAEPEVLLVQERTKTRDAELRADRLHMRRPFSNWDALDVLTNVADADLRRLGIDPSRTHPRAMLMTTLLVPPLKVRPTLTTEEDSRRRGYHGLTRTLANIVKMVRVVREKAAAAHYVLGRDTSTPLPADVATAICELYLGVSNYMWKDKAKVPNHRMTHYAARAHARAVDLSSALRGKRGLYRDALMGKRVNACGRTVVTPAGDLDIDQMGVPRAMAEHLTVPVHVTRHNRTLLERLMGQGRVKAVRDEASDTMIAVTEHNRHELPLIEGWVVERFLQDGDYLLFNRQPTLHRPSIMAHRAVLTDKSVFEMPSPTTTPYNADHDGDEVNMHVPQTVEAVAEARNIMAVPFHIMHPGGTKPVIGLIQDAIDGGYLLSQPDCWLTETEAHELLSLVRYSRDCDPGLPMGHPDSWLTSPKLPPPARCATTQCDTQPQQWHGRQIINLLLPRITLTKELSGGRGHVIIRDGCLLKGTLCSRTLGLSSGSIIHHSCLYCGPLATARFLSDAHRVFCRYLTWSGLSVGITDCLPGVGDAQRYHTLVNAAVDHVDTVRALANELANDPAVGDAAEAQINATLKSLLFKASNVAVAGLRQQGLRNAFAIMIEDGSKGKYINMAQLGGFVGQTFVGGARPEGCKGGLRYAPDDPLPGQTPLATREQLLRQGLIPTPYVRGLRMPMFFNHAMAGREGLVDTAVKTARTGYMQRRAVKAMESVKCAQDYSIRDSNEVILQPRFGGDGLDTMRVMRVPLRALAMDDATLAQHVASPRLCSDTMLHFIARSAQVSDLCAIRDELRASHQRAGLLGQVDCAYLPWNATDVLAMVRADCPHCGSSSPHSAYHLDGDALARCATRLRRLLDELSQLGPAILAHCHLLEALSTAQLDTHLRPCEPCFDRCCERLRELYRGAMLQPGEGIGAFVATAVGEPCTQMSVVGTEPVRLRLLGQKLCTIPIGQLVDNLLGQVFDGTSMERAVSGLECYAVDPQERTRWARVTHVSRHAAVGVILTVRTADGRSVEATASHSFLARRNGRVVPVRGDTLRLGDCLPVNQINLAVDRARGGVNGVPAADGDHVVPGGDDLLQRASTLCESIRLALALWGTAGVYQSSILKEAVCDTASVAASPPVLLPSRTALATARTTLQEYVTQATHAGLAYPAATWLLADFDQALAAGVRWVPIVALESRSGGGLNEPVYDFTVAEECQSFMLANGVFVHNTLNTFHALNVVQAGMTYGVPRMRELLNCSCTISTPLITTTMHPDLPDPAAHAAALARDLPFIKLDALVGSTTSLYVGGGVDAAAEEDSELLRRHAPFLQHLAPRLSSWCLRLELGRKRAGGRNLTPQIVAGVVQNHLGAGAVVLASRVVDATWVLRVYLLDTATTVDHALRDTGNSGVVSGGTAGGGYSVAARHNRRYADLSSSIGLQAKEGEASRLQEINLHRLDNNFPNRAPTAREVVEWRMMWNLREDLLSALPVAGVRGVQAAKCHAVVVQEVDPGTGGLVSKTLHTVAIQGTALNVVASLRGTDRTRLVCNDVMAVARQYGIDAAANVLYNELCACLASSGSRVDERIVSLLVDVMTHRGFIMPITRHGMNRLVDRGVLAKITFEETLDRLFEAAVLGLRDHLRGASENLIVGRPANLGTNLSHMFVDQNGQRLPCGVAPAGHVLSGDVRAIMSVVTEYADYMREHGIVGDAEGGNPRADDTIATWNERLEHALSVPNTQNVHLEAAGGAGTNPGSVYAPEAQPSLYTEAAALDTCLTNSHLGGMDIPLLLNNTEIAHGSSLEEKNDVPFRPSSPLLIVASDITPSASGNRLRDTPLMDQTEPFRPSSPPKLLF